MSIRPSSASHIEALVRDLSSNSAITRESAIARFTLIGRRAVSRLIALAGRAQAATTRAAALRALELIDDPRALDAALPAIDDPSGDVALAAIAVARACLNRRNGARALDRLTAVTLDRTRPDALRLAAFRALSGLNRRTISPLLKSLAAGPADAVQAEAVAGRQRRRSSPDDPVRLLERAAAEGLGDSPDGLRRAVLRAGDRAALSVLLRIVERVRDREGRTSGAARASWATVRGAAHVALANRGSRLGLYDLRESLESANGQVPVEFLTALTCVGDGSCLESMAAAYGRSRTPWFRERLAGTFREIVRRERLTRRHGVMMKIRRRWPEAFEQLVD